MTIWRGELSSNLEKSESFPGTSWFLCSYLMWIAERSLDYLDVRTNSGLLGHFCGFIQSLGPGWCDFPGLLLANMFPKLLLSWVHLWLIEFVIVLLFLVGQVPTDYRTYFCISHLLPLTPRTTMNCSEAELAVKVRVSSFRELSCAVVSLSVRSSKVQL